MSRYQKRKTIQDWLNAGIDAAGGAAGPIGTGAGKVLEWAIDTIWNDVDPRSRFEEGKWYKNPDSPGISEEEMIRQSAIYNKAKLADPNTKYVQDPRWRTKTVDLGNLMNPAIPVYPLPIPLTPLGPSLPHAESGFDRTNYDPGLAYPGIYNDHKYHGPPHPSSRPLGNAAIPSSSQGFFRPY